MATSSIKKPLRVYRKTIPSAIGTYDLETDVSSYLFGIISGTYNNQNYTHAFDAASAGNKHQFFVTASVYYNYQIAGNLVTSDDCRGFSGGLTITLYG